MDAIGRLITGDASLVNCKAVTDAIPTEVLGKAPKIAVIRVLRWLAKEVAKNAHGDTLSLVREEIAKTRVVRCSCHHESFGPLRTCPVCGGSGFRLEISQDCS